MKEIKDEQVNAINDFVDFHIVQFKIDLIILKQLINNRTNDLIDRFEDYLVYLVQRFKKRLSIIKQKILDFFVQRKFQAI